MSALATPLPPDVETSHRVVINGRVVYDPFPKQVAYHQSVARYPLYGGSKGCGKSLAIRWDHYLPSLVVPGLKSLILRRKLEELRRSHIRFVPAEAQQIGAIWKPSDVGAGVIHFPNGSLIEFGHCQHEEDVSMYLSAEYGRESFDEMVTFTEYQYLMISSCCRTTIPGFIPRVGGGTNPGGPDAQWVKRRWIDQDITADEDEDYQPADYEYIAALPTDNPHLNWDEYMRMLNRLPPELRRAYRDGDWNIFLGQYFPEFRRAHHVEAFAPLPASMPRYCGLDWGYASEGVCLWAVVHPDGMLQIEHEYVFNGPRRDKQIVREVAHAIQAINARYPACDGEPITVRATYADPHMDEQRGHESGESMLETMRRAGVPLTRGDDDRINGWARVRAWLRDMPDGRPFLRVHPRCGYLIRTMPAMVMQEDQPEDLDTDSADHACVTGDTRIMTRRGARPISRLGLTDSVLTRQGWKPVEALAVTAYQAPLLRLTFSTGQTLTGTANHPVWTQNRGLVRMDALREDDRLWIGEPTYSAITIGRRVRSGVRRTGRFLSHTISITATAIRRITPSIICNACRRTSISLTTLANIPTTRSIWRRFALWPANGIGLMLGANGTAAYASSADRSLSSIDIAPLSAARVSVARVIASCPAGIGTVYNLTVKDCHEYFANGVLVSNCDALRYLIMGRPAPQLEPSHVAYPPGTVGYLKQSLLHHDVHRRVLGVHNVKKRRYAY